jgi:geranylgeranylglyceryl phosphate synthase family protein
MRLNEWRHITKLDPDKDNTEKIVKTVMNSGTDAVMLSGTMGVTKKKVLNLLEKIRDYDMPKIQEPSYPDYILKDVDYLFIPSVINTEDHRWICGIHKEWVQNFDIPWDKVVPEAYIVLNQYSSVGRLTGSRCDLNEEEAVAYAVMAEKFFKFPIIYIEYSGIYGDERIVRAVSNSLKEAKLFYGGGIDNRDKAEEMGKYATIIVGNIIYDDLNAYLETI